ncbi:MAG TPA: GNAT family N-acetyltransferase [Candidatus Paceibacterota bacterium]|nr:GNAT family N-acetyltransferase [Candidatus Paceibacterota bacterium]HSA36822.1 GNAT family N-acetyltransferase [Candidatus Paceibacterota bacterium]
MGAVYFVDQGGLITVWSLVIDKNYRNMGIGTELVNSGLKIAAKKKRNMTSTITDPSNIPAIKLFKKLGFTEERKRIRLDKIN